MTTPDSTMFAKFVGDLAALLDDHTAALNNTRQRRNPPPFETVRTDSVRVLDAMLNDLRESWHPQNCTTPDYITAYRKARTLSLIAQARDLLDNTKPRCQATLLGDPCALNSGHLGREHRTAQGHTFFTSTELQQER